MTIETRDLRTAAISVRALPEEKQVLWSIAKAQRLTPSEVIRALVRSEGERRGLWPECRPERV